MPTYKVLITMEMEVRAKTEKHVIEGFEQETIRYAPDVKLIRRGGIRCCEARPYTMEIIDIEEE